MMKKFLVAAFAIIALGLIGVWLFQKDIGEAVFDRAVEKNLARDTANSLADGLHIGLCGTGSPLPNADRAGPCNIVIAGDQIFVVDIGEGGARNIALMGFNAGDLGAVLLTHFHSDHFDGLGPLQLFHWTRGASLSPLPIMGPPGVDGVVDGINAAYLQDKTYRIAHHGEEVVPPRGSGGVARPFAMPATSRTVYERGGLVITAFAVNHAPVSPAVGYRFDYRGRSACISGDTAKSENLERACTGVDLLVHEALQPALVRKMQAAASASGNANAARIFGDIIDYHTSPEEAAQSAQVAGAKMLVLSHLVPPLPGALLHPAFLGDAKNFYDGPIIVGEDGMLFTLPANGQTIERSMPMR